jgi:hypothetical protein
LAGFGYDDDDDGSDIGSWMQQRQKDVDSADADYAAGQDAIDASIRDGRYLAAATPDAVRALGAQQRAAGGTPVPQPIRRGDKSLLSDKDIAGIIFNETRSFSGPDIQKAREHVAHAIMNADETWGPVRSTYAKTASAAANPPKVEQPAYQSAMDAVAAACAQRAKGIDPTNGAVFFRFPITPTLDPFQKRPIQTHIKVRNSYTKGDVPGDPAYVNTY